LPVRLITAHSACREVATGDVDISSTSRQDDGDTRGCVLPMEIAY
jgi:hypothetical protein